MPEDYDWMPPSDLPPSVVELGQLYAALASDWRKDTQVAPTFGDVVRLHRLFDVCSMSMKNRQRIDL